MLDWTGHMGAWWWLMAPVMAACWALVVWAVVVVVRSSRGAADRTPDAESLLAERLARGEIDEVEYRRQRALVRS